MKIIVIAPKGCMGKLIIECAAATEGCEIVGAVGPKGRDYIGKDVGMVAGLGYETGFLIADDLESIIENCDGVIDFSTKENALKVLKICVAHKKALVEGTTGFSAEEKAAFKDAGKEIPVLFAANTSRLVRSLNHVLDYLTKTIGNQTDVEIIEMHDRYKLDAPSGTSLEMGEIIAEAMGKNLKDVAVFGREGVDPRVEGTIGYHSVRAGNIPTSHTVIFGGIGERIEITHHAYNHRCFAMGAVTCMMYLDGKAPGYYGVENALGD